MEAKDNEIREALDDARYAGYLLGKQVGIREVVEWIKQVSGFDRFTATNGNKYEVRTILEETWETQLKEWEVDKEVKDDRDKN